MIRDEEMADTETFRVPKFNTFRVRFRHVFTRYEALRVMRFSIYFFIRTTRLCKSIGSSGWEILPACLPAPVWAAIRNYTAGLLLQNRRYSAPG
jgi:hypothetical protein